MSNLMNMSADNKDKTEKLLKLVRESIAQDAQLREKFQIGEKFRFIKDRLNALVNTVEESIKAMEKLTEKASKELAQDEVLVYVYLYNAQGLVVNTWQKMVNPSVFYEYSVNRPIYTEKNDIEAFIRSRSQKVQHGFLTIALKKDDVLKLSTIEVTKDAIGNPLVKVKEGSLKFNRLMSFTHNGIDYEIKENGELQKKNHT